MRWLLLSFAVAGAGLGCTCFNSNTEKVTPPAPTTVDPQCYKNGTAWEESCIKECNGRADERNCDQSCRATAQQLYAKCPVVHATE
ncbi:MAG: hypothetical protein JST54_00165 [Deltaproteobacteria bacterium]|nr:hypothetical protein [Deltaproteobacteria bacterium]